MMLNQLQVFHRMQLQNNEQIFGLLLTITADKE